MAFRGILSHDQMADEPRQQIKSWQRGHDFAICIDTDGCTLDNMWAKQVIVFHPHYMDMNGLRGAEMHFRIHAEHHNLWSTTRGCDRYLAVQHTLNSLLADRQALRDADEAHLRDLLASLSGYVEFIDTSGGKKGFGIPSLREYHEHHGLDFNITRLLAWSEAVDRTFPFVTLDMPAFEGVPATLEYIADKADLLVVSATPYEDLAAWWTQTGLSRHVQAIAGKEMGKKNDHIRLLMEAGGYLPDQVIMLGDGGGDLKAARANKALFYPVVAGREEQAWANAREAFDAFFAGGYRGKMEDGLVAEFEGALLDKGPWEQPGYDACAEYRRLQQKRIDTYKQLHPQGNLLTLD
jgi:phosphoglycolate phosphatase-like HAD superfamily hydrolase